MKVKPGEPGYETQDEHELDGNSIVTEGESTDGGSEEGTAKEDNQKRGDSECDKYCTPEKDCC
jgi:hypothetical protein